MADFELQRLYDVSFDIVNYQQTTQLPSQQQDDITQAFMTPTGQYINRHITLSNRTVSFWFYQGGAYFKQYQSTINTVNKHDLCIGTFIIESGKALLRNIHAVKVPVKFEKIQKDESISTQLAYLYKVFVQLQVQLEKPLLYQKVPLMGYYFNDGDGNSVPKRIQRCETPQQFPHATALPYGYGFYSSKRQDLNVPYKMFLTSEGRIAFNKNQIGYMTYKVRKQTDWKCLHFPKVQGVIKNG